MTNIPDLAALLKASNLAEMQYAINPTPENKAKFLEANKAYRDAYRMPVKREAEVVEEIIADFNIVEDELGCCWIIKNSDKSAYASQTALAWMCEVSEGIISAFTNQTDKCPKALLNVDLEWFTKINFNGREITGIPARLCSLALFYQTTWKHESPVSSDLG